MRNPRRSLARKPGQTRPLSDATEINYAAAARLLRVTPKDIADLVRSGEISGDNDRADVMSIAAYESKRWRERRRRKGNG